MAINPNSGEYKPRIGLDNLYVAVISEDSADAYTAGTPEWMAPVAEATQEPSANQETLYADNSAFDVISVEGETKITLKVTGMPLEMLALVTGRKFDAASGRMFDYSGTPPDVALSFRAKKSNGSYRYYQYLKGKFLMPKEEAATEADQPDIKTTELQFTGVKTIYAFDLGGGLSGTVKRVVGDDDTTNFSSTGWFSQVQTPEAVAPSALSLSSSVPTDGGTGVSVSANQTLTFNNALTNNATTSVVLVKSDGTVIAGAKTLDTAKKVLTIDPTSSLTAGADYILTYAVTDIYGQALAGAINFSTAP